MKNNLNIIIIGLILTDIKETINSINQLMENNKIKIIVVSPENIQNKIKLQFKNKEICYAHDKEKGVYKAMNIGLSLTKSQNSFNWFLNSGDFAVSRNLKIFLNFNKEEYLLSSDIIFFINNKKIDLVSILYSFLNYFGTDDINIIKIFMLILVFPTSHQNIIIKNNIHNKFDVNYKYSSDFKLILKIISGKNINVLIKKGEIAINSIGGLTDLNRFKTIKERRFIAQKHFRRLDCIIIYEISFLIRIILMLIKNSIKNIISLFKK